MGLGIRRRARWVRDRLMEPRRWQKRSWCPDVVSICGSGHSGTTLVYRILRAHPEVFGPNRESDAFLYGRHWMELRQLRLDYLASGRRVLVEKTPLHIRHMTTMRRLIPGIKFIVMVRDGRDVTASFGARFSGDYNRGFADWLTDTKITATEADASDVLCVRYEDLITDPEQQVGAICDFIGVAFDPTMLQFHREPLEWYGHAGDQKGTGSQGQEHYKLRAWQSNQPIYNGAGRWERELPPKVVAEFHKPPAADLMQRFGYL